MAAWRRPLDLDVPDARPDDVAVSALARVRVLTLAALGSLVTGYAAVAAVLALVTAIAPLAHFSTTGVVVAALPGWLAAHQVPLAIGGLELGMLPLLATIGMMLVAARAAAGAAERLGLRGPWQAGHVVGAIAVAHGSCGLAIALAVSGHAVSVDPLAAFYYPALVAALAATLGVLHRCGLWAALVERADPVALRGIRAGLVAVLLLLAAGGALLTFALLTSVGPRRDLFATFAPGLGNGLGMLLLSMGSCPTRWSRRPGSSPGRGSRWASSRCRRWTSAAARCPVCRCSPPCPRSRPRGGRCSSCCRWASACSSAGCCGTPPRSRSPGCAPPRSPRAWWRSRSWCSRAARAGAWGWGRSTR